MRSTVPNEGNSGVSLSMSTDYDVTIMNDIFKDFLIIQPSAYMVSENAGHEFTDLE